MVNWQPHIYMSVVYHLCVSSQSLVCQQPIIYMSVASHLYVSSLSLLQMSVAHHLYVSSLSLIHMSAAYISFVSTLLFMCQKSFISQQPIIYFSSLSCTIQLPISYLLADSWPTARRGAALHNYQPQCSGFCQAI